MTILFFVLTIMRVLVVRSSEEDRLWLSIFRDRSWIIYSMRVYSFFLMPCSSLSNFLLCHPFFNSSSLLKKIPPMLPPQNSSLHVSSHCINCLVVASLLPWDCFASPADYKLHLQVRPSQVDLKSYFSWTAHSSSSQTEPLPLTMYFPLTTSMSIDRYFSALYPHHDQEN